MAQNSPGFRLGTRIVVAGVVAVVVALVTVLAWRAATQRTTDTSEAAPATTSSVPSASPKPSTTPSTTPSSAAPSSASPAASGGIPAGCSSPTKAMDEPTRLTIDAMKVTTHMMSLGQDESGAAAAPPKNDSEGVAWFDEGPKVGSTKGNAVLSIHTYRNGGALGNELRDPETGLEPGDLIRISDASGTTVCYTFERETKVWVKDYDPMSNVLYDYEGAPQAVIVICWDFNRATSVWDSRILYYLKPVAPTA